MNDARRVGVTCDCLPFHGLEFSPDPGRIDEEIRRLRRAAGRKARLLAKLRKRGAGLESDCHRRCLERHLSAVTLSLRLVKLAQEGGAH